MRVAYDPGDGLVRVGFLENRWQALAVRAWIEGAHAADQGEYQEGPGRTDQSEDHQLPLPIVLVTSQEKPRKQRRAPANGVRPARSLRFRTD